MVITDKAHCFGCTACEAVCQRGAITMTPDEEGFLYPEISDARCVSCGRCQAVCPGVARTIPEGGLSAYAARNNDEAVREQSTSGGVFTALSDAMLARGGVIYGVVQDESLVVRHIRASGEAARDRMRGSKYVQSRMDDAIRRVKADLDAGIPVFFTGTPCQTDGLRRALGDPEGLLTCNFICHGVPSPRLFFDHVRHLEAVCREKIVAYRHRGKIHGWHEHNECVTFENGRREYQTKRSQNHKDLFCGHYIIRKSCETCPYAGHPGAADLTIGDFWGIERFLPKLDDNRGVSAVIVNTARGAALLEEAQEALSLHAVAVADILRGNHNKPTEANPRRAEFWADYAAHGYDYCRKRYAGDTPAGRLVYFTKKHLRRLLVRLGVKQK